MYERVTTGFFRMSRSDPTLGTSRRAGTAMSRYTVGIRPRRKADAMAQAFPSGSLVRMTHGERYVGTREAAAQVEDDLGFAAALQFAIPAGLLLWLAAVVALVRFLV